MLFPPIQRVRAVEGRVNAASPRSNEEYCAVRQKILLAARDAPHTSQLLLKYPWGDLGERDAVNSVRKVLLDILHAPLNDNEYEIFWRHFRTSTGGFDHTSFVREFSPLLQVPVSRLRLSSGEITPAVTPFSTARSGKHSSRFNIMTDATTLSTRSNSINDRALQRALGAMQDMLRWRIVNRFSIDITRLGNMQKRDFQMAMKNGLNLKLGEADAEALFYYLDSNGDGIVHNSEITAAMQSMINDIRQQLNTNNFTLRTTPASTTTATAPLSFDPSEFKRAVCILSDAIAEKNAFKLPDSILSQQYIRRCIYEQLGVKLTRIQMLCLCHKLSKIRPHTIVDATELKRSASSVISPDKHNKKMLTDKPIHGKVIENFVVQLRQFVVLSQRENVANV